MVEFDFVTSDWHFGDTRLGMLWRWNYNNLEEMNHDIIQKYNKMVWENAKVLVLGDIIWNKAPEFLSLLGGLNGQKTLIRGNHDSVHSDSELSKYFDRVIPDKEGLEVDLRGKRYYATHYPSTAQKAHFNFNLVGHVHGAWRVQKNMINVGIDAHNFYPISADNVNFLRESIEKCYNGDIFAGDLPQNNIKRKSDSYAV